MQDLDFASLSLRLNPSDRISAHTALIHPYFIQKPVGTSTVCLDVPVKGEVYRSSGRDGNQQQQDHNQKKKTVPVIVNNTNDFLTLVDSMFAWCNSCYDNRSATMIIFTCYDRVFSYVRACYHRNCHSKGDSNTMVELRISVLGWHPVLTTPPSDSSVIIIWG